MERHLQVPLWGPESQACQGLCNKQAEFCPFQAWFYWQRHKTQLETKCFFSFVINRLIHGQSAASAFSPFSAGTICSGSLVDLLIVLQWRTESKMKSLHLHSHKQMAPAQDKACNQKGTGCSPRCLYKTGNFPAPLTPGSLDCLRNSFIRVN